MEIEKEAVGILKIREYSSEELVVITKVFANSFTCFVVRESDVKTFAKKDVLSFEAAYLPKNVLDTLDEVYVNYEKYDILKAKAYQAEKNLKQFQSGISQNFEDQKKLAMSLDIIHEEKLKNFADTLGTNVFVSHSRGKGIERIILGVMDVKGVKIGASTVNFAVIMENGQAYVKDTKAATEMLRVPVPKHLSAFMKSLESMTLDCQTEYVEILNEDMLHYAVSFEFIVQGECGWEDIQEEIKSLIKRVDAFRKVIAKHEVNRS